MFGHLAEFLLVLIVAMAILGPKRLPEIGRSVGKTMKSFRKGVSEDEDKTLPDEPAH